MKPWILSIALVPWVASLAAAQEDVHYELRVEDPASRIYHVEATLPATGAETRVSLPAWTPGHYVISDYARYIRTFDARAADGSPLDWEKVDKDTWRIATAGTDRVQLSYEFLADTISLSGSRLTEDFGFFNGTNLFVYPETGYDFSSTLRIDLPAGWDVVTELDEAGEPGLYRAADYHELVDQPTFLGHFGIDSLQADGVWTRLAIYPAEQLETEFGRSALQALQRIADYLHDFFGEAPPYDRYTTLIYLPEEPIDFAGGLEHADSHFDILPAQAAGNPALLPLLQRLLSHEYFHAWNVKRIRPAELWPYVYDREQFTPLLWFSEGITDYYAALVLARTGLWDEATFWENLSDAAGTIEAIPPASVEDASLDTWIDPIYAPGNYYYDKGKLIGLLLDAMIRDATDGERGLDEVMLRLHREHFLAGEGFSTEDLLALIRESVGDERTDAFYRRHIDGREPLPYREILERVGIEYVAETLVEPFLGVGFESGPDGELIVFEVVPGSAAAEAGLAPGDVLLRVGDVEISGPDWAARFRERYADRAGEALVLTYRRDDTEMRGETTVKTRERQVHRLGPADDADERARGLRDELLTG